MSSLREASTLMIGDQELALVEQAMLTAVRGNVELLTRTGERVIRSGGKRIRPKLVFLAHEAAGGADIFRVVPLAAAVELLHTASLIHDDVNDHSDLRRGQPSVNAELGNGLALLMGDYVFVKLLNLIAAFDSRTIQVLADCCTAIVEGETLQMLNLGNADMSEGNYLAIVAQKTASLFAACCELGSLAAGAPEDQVRALKSYGLNLGMAFQIRDDTLDLVGDSAELGKPVAHDLAQGQVNLATLFVRQLGGNPEILRSGDMQQVLDAVRGSGALAYAMFRAEHYATKAKQALAFLPASRAREEMSHLADFVVARER